MNREKLKLYVLMFFTPLLLITVALTHIYYAKSEDLTPWKGGGFGMFCTVDSKQARFFRLYLIDENGDRIPARIPSTFKNDVSKLKAIPTQRGLQTLVDEISGLTWVDTSFKEKKLYDIAGVDSESSDLVTNNPNVKTVKSLTKFDQVPKPEEVVVVKGIELEFWRYNFDKDQNAISANKYHSISKSIAN